MELEVTTESTATVCIVRVVGEVDVYTAPRLKGALSEAVDSGCGLVVVDMEQVGFIDSSGLGVLVGALRRVKEAGGDLRLVCGRENVIKIFRITGLDKVFPMFSTVDQAQEA
jgi:anti-sigma B factor antagonist